MKFEQLKKIPTEFEEQVAVFSWIKASCTNYPELKYCFSTLNGVRMPMGLSMKCKRAGLLSGVPDIILPLRNKNHHGLFIELKRTKGGSVSPEQKDYLEFLSKNKFYAVTCKGAEEAITIIKNYLKDLDVTRELKSH